MDIESAYSHLKTIAGKMGIIVKEEKVKGEESSAGGYCLIRGKPCIILNLLSTKEDRIKVLAEALKRFDLDTVHIPLWLREMYFREDEE